MPTIVLLPPLDPACHPLTQAFGEHPDWYAAFGLPGHPGLDYAAAIGAPVAAAHPGRCWLNTDPRGYGHHITIVSDDGSHHTIYAHLSGFCVTAAEHVQAGQIIGATGNTGNSTGPHLHFGLKVPGANPRYRDWVDPTPHLEAPHG